MKNGKTLWLLFLSLTVILLSAAPLWAQALNVEAAKKEGKVVVYGSVPPQSMQGLHQAFKKKYGIEVEYWRGSSTQVSERALTEWRAGKPAFDVVEGNRGVQLIMRDDGLFAKYIPPASEKFPAQFKEKDGMITPWRVLPISILYNTELVKAADLPKTLDDLLNPKWSGKISIPDPTRHTTTAQFLWNLRRKDFKGDKWLDYVKALAKQNPVLVESLATVPSTVIKGEALVGITYIKYIKQYKGPIDFVPMDRYLTDPNYLSLSAKSTRANAAKLYIDFACSAEGQKEIAEDGEFVLAPGVYPPIKDADKVAPKMVFMENPSEDEFKKLMSGTFRDILYAK
ncbi:MAG: ABC transporter substrate-binding protein [Candidatus Binatia bacterium]